MILPRPTRTPIAYAVVAMAAPTLVVLVLNDTTSDPVDTVLASLAGVLLIAAGLAAWTCEIRPEDAKARFVDPALTRFWRGLPLALLAVLPVLAGIAWSPGATVSPYVAGAAAISAAMAAWVYGKRRTGRTDQCASMYLWRLRRGLPLGLLALAPVEALVSWLTGAVAAPYLGGAAVISVAMAAWIYARPLRAGEHSLDPYTPRLWASIPVAAIGLGFTELAIAGLVT